MDAVAFGDGFYASAVSTRLVREALMKILFIAPQPFFENRGTPIAVWNMLRVLGDLGHRTDLVTYYAGEVISIPGTVVHRCPRLPFKRIPIGFSYRKLVLDILTYLAVLRRLGTQRYDVIHCVEEGIFLGLLAFPRKSAVICYDMDSSLTEQLAARGKLWRMLAPLLSPLEKWALRKSACVVAVCPALREFARKHAGQKRIFQVEDTPVVRVGPESAEEEMELRRKLSLRDKKVVVYIGNFEAYQGIDLVLRGFAHVVQKWPHCALLIVGGMPKEVLAKKTMARRLGVEGRVVFTGFIPPEKAGAYLSLADVLVSPRTRGTNFPMKIYSYLASGKPVVATDLPVHTQTLGPDIAMMVPPTEEGLARGIGQLLDNPNLGKALSERGKHLVETQFTHEAYRRKVTELYRWIGAEVAIRRGKRT
jgi:glycosyltransferase involved in cell wall biosynthesis